MSSDQKSEVLKNGDKTQYLSDVEMIFGTPTTQKSGKPDVHHISNEKKHEKEAVRFVFLIHRYILCYFVSHLKT